MRLEPPSWWYDGRIPLAAWALLPVSAIYGGLVERRFRTVTPYRGKLPVVCVGNFTMGGAGKTPVALRLAALLREIGRKPAFLTRGFGGRERGPYVVDGSSDEADRVGDEPLLLANTALTVVSRDRPSGAKLLETLTADTIVMDDGFQNPSLEKDFSLLVIDGGSGVGSGRVFPLGPLRAPLAFQAAKADAILILGGRQSSGEIRASLERQVLGKTPSPQPSPQGERGRRRPPLHQNDGEPRFPALPLGERETPRPFSPSRFLGNAIAPSCKHARRVCAGEGQDEGVLNPASAVTQARRLAVYEADIVPLASDELRNSPFLAFCGIGRPTKFFDTLRQAGVAILKCRIFPDHHPYSEADATSLIAEAKTLKAGLLTTEKDHVRMKGKAGAVGELYRSAATFPITIKFSGDDEALLMRSIVTAIDEHSIR